MKLVSFTLLFHILRFGANAAPMTEEAIPSTGEDWVSLSKTVEFQPSNANSKKWLRDAQRRFLGYSDNFVDGSETQYDEGSQAWRYLGVYVDCSAAHYQENAAQQNEGRGLEDGNNDDQNQASCQRYLLWAAYIDPGYQGGGYNEYQYYDLDSKNWDKSACEVTNNKRCAKMDCHLSGTHFQLLGFFKQIEPTQWFESLLQHQGSCSLPADDYELMSATADWWPQDCTYSNYKDATSGVPVYYDIAPQPNGGLDVALYKNNNCSTKYKGSYTLEDAVGDENADYQYEQIVQTWNDGMEYFKICQPCVTLNINAQSYQSTNGGNSNGKFVCTDASGSQSTNQCAMFKEETDMRSASYRDVALASQQGSITQSYKADVKQTFWNAWGFLLIGGLMFLLGILAVFSVARRPRRKNGAKAQPLLGRRFRNHSNQ